jgi:hypothetical protein
MNVNELKTLTSFTPINDTDGYILIGQTLIQWGVVSVSFNGSVTNVEKGVSFGIPYDTTTGLAVFALFSNSDPEFFGVGYKTATLATTGVTLNVYTFDGGTPSYTDNLYWLAVGIAKK